MKPARAKKNVLCFVVMIPPSLVEHDVLRLVFQWFNDRSVLNKTKIITLFEF